MKSPKETVELHVGKLIVGNGKVLEDVRIGLAKGDADAIGGEPRLLRQQTGHFTGDGTRVGHRHGGTTAAGGRDGRCVDRQR